MGIFLLHHFLQTMNPFLFSKDSFPKSSVAIGNLSRYHFLWLLPSINLHNNMIFASNYPRQHEFYLILTSYLNHSLFLMILNIIKRPFHKLYEISHLLKAKFVVIIQVDYRLIGESILSRACTKICKGSKDQLTTRCKW